MLACIYVKCESVMLMRAQFIARVDYADEHQDLYNVRVSLLVCLCSQCMHSLFGKD